MRNKGFFITLEGIEGAGKSSQVSSITATLEKFGYDVLVTREPGGVKLSEKIRKILLDPQNKGLAPLAELFLYLADRAQHVEETIRPALKKGQVVVCDRYADATVAYQVYGRGLDLEMVQQMNRHATAGLTPDLTLLFDLPVEIGLIRARGRIDSLAEGQPTEDRFEQETVEFHQRVRDGYLALAEAEPERFVIIDATADIETAARAIQGVLATRPGKKESQR